MSDLRHWITLCEAVTGVYTGSGSLWHGTDLLGLTSILQSDHLSKSIDTDNPAGASLTYDQEMAWSFADRSSYIFKNNHYYGLIDGMGSDNTLGTGWPHGEPPETGAVLEFNVDRLRQQYKIVSYSDDPHDDEKEVRVLGDHITPVLRFLTGFSFVPQDAQWYAAYLMLPDVRRSQDWFDPEASAKFLLNLHTHPLFRAKTI
jgi:hypothetical protein